VAPVTSLQLIADLRAKRRVAPVQPVEQATSYFAAGRTFFPFLLTVRLTGVFVLTFLLRFFFLIDFLDGSSGIGADTTPSSLKEPVKTVVPPKLI
jgi:hypothetical protein